MIIFSQPRLSAIERLKLKEWKRSMENISEAEIISIDPYPLKYKDNKELTNLPLKVTNNGTK